MLPPSSSLTAGWPWHRLVFQYGLWWLLRHVSRGQDGGAARFRPCREGTGGLMSFDGRLGAAILFLLKSLGYTLLLFLLTEGWCCWGGTRQALRAWEAAGRKEKDIISTSSFKIYYISMASCKKDVTPLLGQWSYVFLARSHRYIIWDLSVYPNSWCLR